MIELQSVGLKFGLATKKESEYKYTDPFKQRKNALFSAIRESLGFWNFEYSEILPLVMPAQLLLPWQILNFKATGYVIREMSFFEFEKPFVVPLAVLNDAELFDSWADKYDSYSPTDSNIMNAIRYDMSIHRMSFFGQVALTDMDGYDMEGLYCLVLPGYAISEENYLSDNTSLTYTVSEPFSFSRNVDNFATLLFNNNINLAMGNGAEIDFSEGFFFKMLLPSQLGRPSYVFEETLTERQGYKFVENQTSKKTFDISFPANESMCDTLRIARLCCNRQIKSLERYHDIIAMDMSVEWLEQGDIASVKMTIEEDNIINHNGGYIGDLGRGDFSEEDFNNDYFDVQANAVPWVESFIIRQAGSYPGKEVEKVAPNNCKPLKSISVTVRPLEGSITDDTCHYYCTIYYKKDDGTEVSQFLGGGTFNRMKTDENGNKYWIFDASRDYYTTSVTFSKVSVQCYTSSSSLLAGVSVKIESQVG